MYHVNWFVIRKALPNLCLNFAHNLIFGSGLSNSGMAAAITKLKPREIECLMNEPHG